MTAFCDPRGRYYGEPFMWVRESDVPCAARTQAAFVPPAMLTPKTKKLRKVSQVCSNPECRKPLELERVGDERYCLKCANAAKQRSAAKAKAKHAALVAEVNEARARLGLEPVRIKVNKKRAK